MTRERSPNLSPEQLARIADLDAEFKTHSEIAAIVGVGRSTVTRALQRIDEDANEAEELQKTIARVKSQQLRRIEHIAREAMQAWEKSKQPKVKSGSKVVNKTGKNFGTDTEAFEATEEQTGQPAYLLAALKAFSDAREILGANAPAKSEVAATVFGAIHTGTTDELNERVRSNPKANQLIHELLIELDNNDATDDNTH